MEDATDVIVTAQPGETLCLCESYFAATFPKFEATFLLPRHRPSAARSNPFVRETGAGTVELRIPKLRKAPKGGSHQGAVRERFSRGRGEASW